MKKILKIAYRFLTGPFKAPKETIKGASYPVRWMRKRIPGYSPWRFLWDIPFGIESGIPLCCILEWSNNARKETIVATPSPCFQAGPACKADYVHCKRHRKTEHHLNTYFDDFIKEWARKNMSLRAATEPRLLPTSSGEMIKYERA